MGMILITAWLLIIVASASACSPGPCGLLDKCSSNQDCEGGLYCFYCVEGFSSSKCVRSAATDQFKLLNNSLPFNKYAFLTTHNAYAIDGYPSRTGVPRLTVTNQEDTVTQQLNNGVRALMLDTYDFKGDVWLCHSFKGHCYDYTAFGPAVETLKEIEAFLSANPSEIVTIILEDYVRAPNGLTKVFIAAGLMKYWFPLAKMPKNGQDWPLVSDMVKNNRRLLVFTSIKSKEKTEGIAYQWNYMVENQCKNVVLTDVFPFSWSHGLGIFLLLLYLLKALFSLDGDGGMHAGSCPNRAESPALRDNSKSLVLVNYFRTIAMKELTCIDNSGDLIDMLHTCYTAAGNRWANFVAVNYYKRSEGGGSFQAVDTLNGKLLCGCNDIHACLPGSSSAACSAQHKASVRKLQFQAASQYNSSKIQATKMD